MAERMMKIEELQKCFSVSRATIERWVAEGTFPAPIRIQRRTLRWLESDVDKFVDSRPRATAGDKA